MEILAKIRNLVENNREELFLVAVILLVALASFGLGRLSALESSEGGYGELEVVSAPVSDEELAELAEKVRLAGEDGAAALEAGESGPTEIVGNKNSKIFHRADCSGARNMSEANKIYFASVEAAVAAGYRPAGNCPGL
jgi:hypothetical protein